MAAAAYSKVVRRLSRSLNSINRSRFLSSSSSTTILHQNNHSIFHKDNTCNNNNSRVILSKQFCSQFEGPAAIDYSALLEEDDFHKLADATIHDLLEKIEEYGDSVDIDGFDIDYGNQVLTVKFGSLGTYVLNKQTPNRQIWMSSPVSGPSRFDWDRSTEAWIYRRTKAKLLETLENEIQQLCHEPIKLT